MSASEEDVLLCVLMQASEHCSYKKFPMFLRLAVNGVLQADIVSKRITGLEGTFVVMVRLPGGVRNIAMLQMGTSRNEHMFQLAPNNHIVDIEHDTLLLMTWGKQLQRLHLFPGRQLMFILPDAGKNRLAVQGSIRQLSCWKDALDNYSLRIPNTATLLALPVKQKLKSVAFKLVRKPESGDGMEWEQPLHKNKTISLAENVDGGNVIVTRWNESSVNKTEVFVSQRGYRVRDIDSVMYSIFKYTSDMYKCINNIPIEEDENTITPPDSADGVKKPEEDGDGAPIKCVEDSAKTEDEISPASQTEEPNEVTKEKEDSKPAVLDVLQASDVGDILRFACSCETIATTVNQDDDAVSNDQRDDAMEDAATGSLHGDVAMKTQNEPAIFVPTDEGTMGKDTMFPAIPAPIPGPNTVYTSVSSYKTNIMPGPQTDSSTDPGTVKRKKSKRFKKLANTRLMMWVMHKH